MAVNFNQKELPHLVKKYFVQLAKIVEKLLEWKDVIIPEL